MDEQLVDIETKVAYQERAMTDTARALLELSQRVDRIEKAMEMLSRKLAGQQPGEPAEEPRDEKPPHY